MHGRKAMLEEYLSALIKNPIVANDFETKRFLRIWGVLM